MNRILAVGRGTPTEMTVVVDVGAVEEGLVARQFHQRIPRRGKGRTG